MLAFWIPCAILTALVAARRGARGGIWFVLGLMLGPLALIAAFGAESPIKCPRCRANVPADSNICPICRTDPEAYRDDSEIRALIAALRPRI